MKNIKYRKKNLSEEQISAEEALSVALRGLPTESENKCLCEKCREVEE